MSFRFPKKKYGIIPFLYCQFCHPFNPVKNESSLMPIPMLAMPVKGYAGAAWKGYKGPFRAKKSQHTVQYLLNSLAMAILYMMLNFMASATQFATLRRAILHQILRPRPCMVHENQYFAFKKKTFTCFINLANPNRH